MIHRHHLQLPRRLKAWPESDRVIKILSATRQQKNEPAGCSLGSRMQSDAVWCSLVSTTILPDHNPTPPSAPCPHTFTREKRPFDGGKTATEGVRHTHTRTRTQSDREVEAERQRQTETERQRDRETER